MHPWEWPSKPWERLHIDFAGPLLAKSFLIVVDAYSKWAEVIEMQQTHCFKRTLCNSWHSSSNCIRQWSAVRVADFEEFTHTNGIKHSRSSPYHPATNGEAERFVCTFKEAMKTSKGDGLTLTHRLQNFLLTYRTTPHSTTGTPRCDLLMGRRLRTRWDLLKPDIRSTIRKRQSQQKKGHDRALSVRSFKVGQEVMARNFRVGAAWIKGIIVRQLGPNLHCGRL